MDLRSMRPEDGEKEDPKAIRKGRIAAEPNWESIVRSFNPNTIGLDVISSFWFSLMMRLADLSPGSLAGDVSGSLSYDEKLPQRFYASDLRLLRSVSSVSTSYQDFGNDSRTIYIRSLLSQGAFIASENGLLASDETDKGSGDEGSDQSELASKESDE